MARSFVINDSISHVIAGKRVKIDWDHLKRLENKPHVVTVEWLAQSLRLKTAAPEADYLHPELENLCHFKGTRSASKNPSRRENINDSLEEMQLTLQSLIGDQIDKRQPVNFQFTHLVYSKTDGIKYEKDIEQGVPATSPERVIACAMSSAQLRDFSPAADLSMLNTSSYQMPKIHIDNSSSDTSVKYSSFFNSQFFWICLIRL